MDMETKTPKKTRLISLLFLAVYVNLLSSCVFYKSRPATSEDGKPTSAVERKQFSNYIILHVGTNTWELANVSFAPGEVSGELRTPSEKVMYYYKKLKNGAVRRIPHKDRAYAEQVHIYADQFTKRENRVVLTDSDIREVEAYNVDGALTTLSHVGTVLVAVVGGFAILLAIACSCPHVYSYDGTTYHMNNTLFTGAINSKLERHDYKVMPDYFPSSNTYQFIVQNEENEKQYTNLLELVVVEHDKNFSVLPDQDGNLYSVSAPVTAVSVKDDSDADLTPTINYEDDKGHAFNNSSAVDYAHVYARFDQPENTNGAKLILRAKTNPWAGIVYKEFSKLFGRYYDNWTGKNQKNSKEEIEAQMKSMGIPLLVSIKNGEEWIDLETIDLVGEINYNSLVVSIDEKYLQDGPVEIRLRSGFMFWKLDYLAMDFSPEQEFSTHYLKPSVARGNKDMDYRAALNSDDDYYMEHLVTGDSTYVEFSAVPRTQGMAQTIILHSKGYYTIETEYKGKPEREELAKFKNEGELSRFSRALYNEYFGELTVNFE